LDGIVEPGLRRQQVLRRRWPELRLGRFLHLVGCVEGRRPGPVGQLQLISGPAPVAGVSLAPAHREKEKAGDRVKTTRSPDSSTTDQIVLMPFRSSTTSITPAKTISAASSDRNTHRVRLASGP